MRRSRPGNRRSLRCTSRGADMGDKSPKKTNAKKPSKTLKEKRAAKQDKGQTMRGLGER